VDSNVTDQLLIRYWHSSDTGEKMGDNGSVHQQFLAFKKAYDLVRKKVLYNILSEFGIPM
jgi:hypothetical protein